MSLPKPDYEREGVKLWLSDCLEILPLIPVGAVDAVITDPPYAISIAGAMNDSPNGKRNFDFFAGDSDWKTMNALVSTAICKAAETSPLSIATWCSHRQVGFINEILESAGYSTRLLFWRKKCPPPSAPNAGFANAVEICVYGYKPGRFWGGGQYDANIFDCDNYRHGQPGKVDHPTQKPTALIIWQVEIIAPPGGTILDPFTGSGTTAVACIRTGRRFLGCEIEPRYFEIAVKRIEQAFADTAMFREAEAEHKQEQGEMFP